MTRNSVLCRGFLADPSSIAKILTSSLRSSANITRFEYFNNLPPSLKNISKQRNKQPINPEECLQLTNLVGKDSPEIN